LPNRFQNCDSAIQYGLCYLSCPKVVSLGCVPINERSVHQRSIAGGT